MKFEWDNNKERANIAKHGVDFESAKLAFFDLKRVVVRDEKHSETEDRFICIGAVDGRVLTVRFTIRDEVIRIIGAAEWRKQRKIYESQ